MNQDLLWLNIRELPYFRGLLRAVEGRLVKQIELPGAVLDLGCGDGHFSSVTFDHPLDIGLDPSMKIMRDAQKRNVYRLLVQAEGAMMPFASSSFSSALSNSVLEHIPHLKQVLSELARVLKPGAPFVFTVPNPGYRSKLSVSNALEALRLGRLARSYQEWFMRMSRTVNLWNEQEWTRLLKEAGFQIEEAVRYFSPSALHVLEWGHYFGVPCLLWRWLTGRWIIAPMRWNLWLTEWMVRHYYEESPSEEGTYTFFLARKEAPRQRNGEKISAM